MEKITIVKVGGAIVEDDQRLPQLLQAFAAISGPKILVHGGGRSATKIAAALGIESHMVDGRRITDAEMLRVVTMVYGGLVNKQLVARLQALGVNAVGLTGADIDVIRSHKRPLRNGIDYGFVGDVDRVDAPRLAQLLHEGITPVLAPLTHDGMGHLLNTNADTIASETASALAALKTDATAAPATNNPDEIAAIKTEGAGEPLYDVTLVYCFASSSPSPQPLMGITELLWSPLPNPPQRGVNKLLLGDCPFLAPATIRPSSFLVFPFSRLIVMTGLLDFRTSGLPISLPTSGNDWTSGLPDFWTSILLNFRTSGLPDF
jgi:acetylglutamate kinase